MFIKKYRKLRKMSQADLAHAIGVTPSVISKYESGSIILPTNKLFAIANVLEVSVNDLLEEPISDQATSLFSTDVSQAQLDHLFPIQGHAIPTSVQSTNYDHLAYFQPAKPLIESIIKQVDGRCELCEQKYDIPGMSDQHFLEAHHVVWMSQGGKNEITNIVVLCPNCHKKVHIINFPEDTDKLIKAAAKHK